MNKNTINADVTMGGATGTLLAGRYRVVRQLGQGGMGSVWLAEDTKLDGFKVAIKMLPSVLVNNKRAYAQVKAEALVSLKLSHPNIVTVRAFEEEGGNPFLVMDYIDGQTLDDYLAEKGKLTEEETIRLLKPVAAALDYAHAQGVVHRDVKPGNVMIRKDGTPFVLDFGIAREIQETMTRVTGKLSSGTLLYMSPEQLRGAIPAPAQDVYSFAAMAYECLTGNPPFARGQVEYQIEHVEPAPLGPQFIKCGPGVMAGLEKQPENRPASCSVLFVPDRGRTESRSARSAAEARCNEELPLKRDDGKGWLIGTLLAVLMVAVIGVLHSTSGGEADRRRLHEAQMTFDRARTSLCEQVRKLEAISREDGFGSRMDAISEKMPTGIGLRDSSSFLNAAQNCAGLEDECRQLLFADGPRVRAKTARDAARAAKQKAQSQYASQDARVAWQEAESAYGQGQREFVGFDFEKAQSSFAQSGQLYEKSASEAAAAREERQKAELARQEQQAKEEELRKKNEKEIADLREACMSAKKAAEDAEASEFASKEMSDALKLLADADNVTDGDRKQAYLTASNAFERARQVAMEASKPKVTLKAMLNGEEVNATVVSGLKDKTRKTPVVIDLSGLEDGAKSTFGLTFLLEGVRYGGVGSYVVRRGMGNLVVNLTRVVTAAEKAAQAESNRLVGRWTGNHARHPNFVSANESLVFRSDGSLLYECELDFKPTSSLSNRITNTGTWIFANGHLMITMDGQQIDYAVVWCGANQFELRFIRGAFGEDLLSAGRSFAKVETPRIFYRR